MTTTHPVDELFEFLTIAGEKGFLNANTVSARRTACTKMFDILDPDQKTVEYVRDNLDVIKTRFMNLNKNISGGSADEYRRRVQIVIDDFTAWTEDRAAWERSVSAKAAATKNDEKKPRAAKVPPRQAEPSVEATRANDTSVRNLEFPIRRGFDAKVTIPRDVTKAEIRRLAYFLLPYAADFNTDEPESGVTDPLNNLLDNNNSGQEANA